MFGKMRFFQKKVDLERGHEFFNELLALTAQETASCKSSLNVFYSLGNF